MSPSSELLKLRVALGVLELCGILGAVVTHVHQSRSLTAMTVGITQIHFLLSWVLGDTPENDAGQHGTKNQGEAAGHPLDTGEVAPSRAAENRIPNVSILEAHGGLHEKQVAMDRQEEKDRHLGRQELKKVSLE